MRKLIAFVALSVVPSIAFAQADATAGVGSTATVLQQISVVAGQDLAFGKVGQNVAKSVDANAATSGRFNVVGQGAARYELTITLPANLVSGSDNLLIDTWTGREMDDADGDEGAEFTPVSAAVLTRTLPGVAADANQKHFYRLGATVRPTASQAAGNYSATITVDATYIDI